MCRKSATCSEPDAGPQERNPPSGVIDSKPSYDELVERVRELETAEVERARTEKDLRKSATLIEALLDAIPDVIGLQDTDHGIIRYNAAGYKMLGRTFDEVAGKKCFELIGQDRACLICATSQSYRTKQPARVEKFVPELDVWLDVRSYPLLDSEGRIQFVIEHLRDITDQKQAEKALKESEKRYRNLFTNTHAVMLVIDPDTADIVDANPAAVSYYGWSLEELTAKRITEINLLTEQEVFREMKRAREERRNHFRFKHRLANGDHRDVEVYSSPIERHGTQLLFSIIHDITERTLAEKALLEERDKLKKAVAQIRALRGMLPICSSCKKIRDDRGYWNQIEAYISERSEAEFSHGICPDCYKRLYPGMRPLEE